MIEALRTTRRCWRSLCLYFLIFCIFGQLHFSPFVLSFHGFLVLSVKQLVHKAYQDGVPWMDDFWLSVPQI
jgi:hypothetical protein